jgi:guanylate kinase
MIVTFTGPSGCGKNTVVNALVETYPDIYERVVTCTTRQPRVGERCGVDYYFLDPPSFNALVTARQFLERTTFCGNSYGLLYTAISAIRDKGKTAVFICDPEGVRSLSRITPVMNSFHVYMHIDKQTRQDRMIRRGDTISAVEERIKEDDARFYHDPMLYNLALHAQDGSANTFVPLIHNMVLEAKNGHIKTDR